MRRIATVSRVIPLTVALAVGLVPAAAAQAADIPAATASTVEVQEGDIPPMTMERVRQHRQDIVGTVLGDKTKAIQLSVSFANADGSPAEDGAVLSTDSITYNPATGMLVGGSFVTFEDGTTKTITRLRCVTTKKCWSSDDGRKWQRVTIVVTIGKNAGFDDVTVKETLSENSAVLVGPDGKETMTVTLEPGAMALETLISSVPGGGEDIRLAARVAVADAPKVKAPAKRSIKPGSPTMTIRYSI